MHGMHARLPKNFVLEERLERYAPVIELTPTHYAGLWRDACHTLGAGTAEYQRVHVDLGCGKGAYVVQAAQAHPDTLFVAIDGEPICVAYTAQHVTEAELSNVVVVPGLGSQVAEMFGPHEVDAITLNFPTPFPRKKEADKRLTIVDRLMEYRRVLAPGATVLLKTDSLPLWRFSQTQFDLAGYDVTWLSDNARAERPDDVPTEYEMRLTAQGATVYAIEGTPGPKPAHVEQTASLSLVDYLPDDLSSLGYVPHGMQGSVTNLRNRKMRAEARWRRR
ncbi:MAG: methyltransferase [Atopobiaceae bacterium]|nr:methyltransferase [Atopobiaceae bacterium]